MNTISVDFWQLIGGAFAVVVPLCTAFFVLIKIIVKQFKSHVDSKFTALEQNRAEDKTDIENKFTSLEKSRQEDRHRWEERRKEDQGHLDDKFKTLEASNQRQERELMELKAELPNKYVQREDWIRLISRMDYLFEDLRKDLTDLLGEVKSFTRGKND